MSFDRIIPKEIRFPVLPEYISARFLIRFIQCSLEYQYCCDRLLCHLFILFIVLLYVINMIKRRTRKVLCFVFCFLMENIKGCSFHPYNNILFIKFYTLKKKEKKEKIPQ